MTKMRNSELFHDLVEKLQAFSDAKKELDALLAAQIRMKEKIEAAQMRVEFHGKQLTGELTTVDLWVEHEPA